MPSPTAEQKSPAADWSAQAGSWFAAAIGIVPVRAVPPEDLNARVTAEAAPRYTWWTMTR